MQTKVKIADKIIGILTMPDDVTQKIPAVLMLHGFASHKDEIGNFYIHFADLLAKQGIASLRIDFFGWGESVSTPTTEITIDSLIEDAALAYDFLVSQEYVDVDRISVCGFSLGAGIAILTMSLKEKRFHSMLFLSPAGDLVNDFALFLGQDVCKKGAEQDETEINLVWREPFKLSKHFFQSLDKYKLQEHFSKFKGRFFAIAGSEDFSCAHAKAYANLSGKGVVILDGRDHVFNITNESDAVSFLQDENLAACKTLFS